jgi:hypothetical protein
MVIVQLAPPTDIFGNNGTIKERNESMINFISFVVVFLNLGVAYKYLTEVISFFNDDYYNRDGFRFGSYIFGSLLVYIVLLVITRINHQKQLSYWIGTFLMLNIVVLPMKGSVLPFYGLVVTIIIFIFILFRIGPFKWGLK